jgi:hypothetical protein
MSNVEASLRRLQNNLSRFVEASALLRDVKALRIQIELRRQALQDIALIQGRLGTFLHCGEKLARRRLQSRLPRRRTGRSRLAGTLRAGPVRCQV